MPEVDSFEDAADLLVHFVDVQSREFLIELWHGLVDATPVKTGKAHASWFISAGSPKTRELPDGNYGRPSEPDLSKYKRNYKSWYVTNTAPYIAELNNGSSAKAPVGFVETTINNVTVKFNG